MKNYSTVTNEEERFLLIEKDESAYQYYISNYHLQMDGVDNSESIINGRDYHNAVEKIKNSITCAEALMDRRLCNWHLLNMPENMKHEILSNLGLIISCQIKTGEEFTIDIDRDIMSGRCILSSPYATIANRARVRVIFPGLVSRDCVDPESGKKYPTVFPIIIEEIKF